jgi:hypothetical protein
MKRITLPVLSLFFILFCNSCINTETPKTDFGLDYQPLEVGLFWEYAVEETEVFGERDEESRSYFLKDEVDYFFINAQNEQVFVIKRSVSADKQTWVQEGNYALQVRNNTLIRNYQNTQTVNLVFPPVKGLKWDGMVLNARDADQFEIDFVGNITLGQQTFNRVVRVLQEEEDDLITFKDNRYEVYAKGIGLIEHYYEVFTYCSRSDCLGKQLVDSGLLRHMTILGYGKN